MNDNRNGNGLLQGLIIGALIGGGAVFLLGTKKGKKLLKAISEEGFEGLSELGDFVEDEAEEMAYEEEAQAASIPPAPIKTQSEVIEKEPPKNPVSGHRRLFRGIMKKSVS